MSFGSRAPGAPYGVYFEPAGGRIVFGPTQWKDEVRQAGAARMLSDGTENVDGPYVPATYPANVGPPDIIEQMVAAVTFGRAAGPAYRPIMKVLATPGYFGMCPFKETSERFTIPHAWALANPSGMSIVVTLLRRPFLDYLDTAFWPPPNPTVIAAQCATVIEGDDGATSFTSAVVNSSVSPDPGNGRTMLTITSTDQPIASYAFVYAHYAPLYLMRRSLATAPSRALDAEAPRKEPRLAAFEEIN